MKAVSPVGNKSETGCLVTATLSKEYLYYRGPHFSMFEDLSTNLSNLSFIRQKQRLPAAKLK
jgi:hypothetical protein